MAKVCICNTESNESLFKRVKSILYDIYIYSFLQKVKSQYKNSEKVTVAILDENDDKDHRKDLSVEIRTVETVHHLLKREKKKKKKKK